MKQRERTVLICSLSSFTFFFNISSWFFTIELFLLISCFFRFCAICSCSSDDFRLYFFLLFFSFVTCSRHISYLDFPSNNVCPFFFGLPLLFPLQFFFLSSLCLVLTSLPNSSLLSSSIYLGWLIGECLFSIPITSSFSVLLLYLDWLVNASRIKSFLFATCFLNLQLVAKFKWKGFFIGNLWLWEFW